MSRLALELLLTDGGQDLVEYALLAGLLALAIAAAVTTLSQAIGAKFAAIAAAFS